MTVSPLYLCLDLNIWCAAFLAERKGAQNTASQTLVSIVKAGCVGDIPVQLIVSWGMLTRLRKVFEVDWGVSRQSVDSVIEAIIGYAGLGPLGLAPHLTLGGTGLMPMRDLEDAHVLETALSSHTHLLVTANFDDFLLAKADVLEPGKVAIVSTADAKLVVAHPFRAVEWFRAGLYPDVGTITPLFSKT